MGTGGHSDTVAAQCRLGAEGCAGGSGIWWSSTYLVGRYVYPGVLLCDGDAGFGPTEAYAASGQVKRGMTGRWELTRRHVWVRTSSVWGCWDGDGVDTVVMQCIGLCMVRQWCVKAAGLVRREG